MEQKKQYRSAVKSKRHIREAFLALLQEKDFEAITVTDIVKRADIHRSTFYAHYPDIYGLLDEIEDEAIRHSMALMSQMEFSSIFQDPIPFLRSLNAPLQENEELYRLLSRSRIAQPHLEKIKNLFVEFALNTPEIPEEVRRSRFFAIRVNFFIGGIMNAYQQWLAGRMDCTLEEISQDIAHLLQKSAENILDPDWLG